jgi:uncharacterized SAM-binding protein YcdF (DUF218 family)/cyclophilin family peptidyl-prolyl cis-trans isomerase
VVGLEASRGTRAPSAPLGVIVVLGGRVRLDEGGNLTGALGRRVAEGARAAARREKDLVVATGGRRWGAHVEALAMAEGLARLGVARERIVTETRSRTTRGNALHTARELRARGIRRALVVTCDWHLPRALLFFRRVGLEVQGLAVPSPPAGALVRRWRRWRERVARLGGLFLVMALGGCGKGAGSTAPAPDASVPMSAVDPALIERAEDLRRAQDVTPEARTSHDVATRRLAARALARIADAASVEGLLRALSDEDAETAAWGAYGLGATCKDREAFHVKALAAKAASLPDEALDVAPEGPDREGAPSAPPRPDLRTAIARALGKCGGALAEHMLAAWLRANRGDAERAAYALGDVARRRPLDDETITALLDAAAPQPGDVPVDAALHPFASLARVPDAFLARVVAAARAGLTRAGPDRIFAVRALGRSGVEGIQDLRSIVADRSFTPAERAEAAHALGQLDKAGRAAAADALLSLVSNEGPGLVEGLGGAEYGVLVTLVGALGADAPKKAEKALVVLSGLQAPGDASSPLARRIAEVRCRAAAARSRGAYDAELLRVCAAPDSEAYQRARLTSLLARGELRDARRKAWEELARSPHVLVREAALSAMNEHPELHESGRAALVEALTSPKPGLVATAADVLRAHPSRGLALAASERRAALDPSAPAPTAEPKQELDPAIARALRAALAARWSEDLVETRFAIIEAAVAVGIKEGRDAAIAACKDPNATMRAHAQTALMSARDGSRCPPGDPPDAAPAPAGEIAHPLAKPTRVTFHVDSIDAAGGSGLAIVFDPSLAPVAATRFVELARAGFYTGVVVHRVLPWFVVQFGDPGGDGYGGSGKLLRCETSPVTFGPLDVGVALAGRDTGSSQIFVALARAPHLDGDYAEVGHAEGDWWRVAEGDTIGEVTVED